MFERYHNDMRDSYSKQQNYKVFDISYRSFVSMIVKQRFLKLLAVPKHKIFTLSGDLLGNSMLLNQQHEPALTCFIRDRALAGMKDFLIDIGANIGLISIQTGVYFDEVHCVEPNPIAFSVLDANLYLSGIKSKTTVHKVAIGSEDNLSTLRIPNGNLGGAFMPDSGNSYSLDVLARKDGWSEFRSENYMDIPIKVLNGNFFFRELFAKLNRAGKNKGIVKIDVEGYEKIVLQKLFEELPKHFSITVVFENWSHDLEIDDVLDRERFNLEFFSFHTTFPWYQRGFFIQGLLRRIPFLKIIFFIKGLVSTQVISKERLSGTGELIIEVAPN